MMKRSIAFLLLMVCLPVMALAGFDPAVLAGRPGYSEERFGKPWSYSENWFGMQEDGGVYGVSFQLMPNDRDGLSVPMLVCMAPAGELAGFAVTCGGQTYTAGAFYSSDAIAVMYLGRTALPLIEALALGEGAAFRFDGGDGSSFSFDLPEPGLRSMALAAQTVLEYGWLDQVEPSELEAAEQRYPVITEN